jgi:hypothetical protein
MLLVQGKKHHKIINNITKETYNMINVRHGKFGRNIARHRDFDKNYSLWF